MVAREEYIVLGKAGDLSDSDHSPVGRGLRVREDQYRKEFNVALESKQPLGRILEGYAVVVLDAGRFGEGDLARQFDSEYCRMAETADLVLEDILKDRLKRGESDKQ